MIPSEMRDNVSEGEKPVTIKNGERLILKKVSDLGKNFGEDIAFARKTEEARQSYKRGEFVSRPADKFLEELDNLEVEHESNFFKKIHRMKNNYIKEWIKNQKIYRSLNQKR